jgi:hypothetical protein
MLWTQFRSAIKIKKYKHRLSDAFAEIYEPQGVESIPDNGYSFFWKLSFAPQSHFFGLHLPSFSYPQEPHFHTAIYFTFLSKIRI